MMSATDAQWYEAIALTAQLPTRSEQISTLEVIATELEAVADPSLQAEALRVLVDACAANGELVRAHEPLGRLLQIYADHPYVIRWVGELIVTIKRLAWRACRFPEVPRTQVLETIKHLEQWCAAEDAGMNSIYGAHLDWAVHRGDSLAAAEFYALQTAAPTGSSSDDCLACLADSWANYQAGLGQDEEAVRLFEAAFSQDQDCTEHLKRGLSASLLPLVRLGRLGEARDAHVKGFGMVRGDIFHQNAIAGHLEFLARTGNEARGLSLLRSHAAMLSAAETPLDRMNFLASAALLLGRVMTVAGSETPVPGPLGRTTAGLVARYARSEALTLAAAFDARNGTDHQTIQVHKVMDAEPLVAQLRLGLGEPLRRTTARVHRVLPGEAVRHTTVAAALEAVLWAEDAGDDIRAATARCDLATAYAKLDRGHEAAEFYRATLESVADDQQIGLCLRAAIGLVAVSLETGDLATAACYNMHASRLLEASGQPSGAASRAADAGALFDEAEEYPQAAQAYRRSAALFVGMDEIMDAQRQQYMAVHALRNARQCEEAIAALDEAAAMVSGLEKSDVAAVWIAGDPGREPDETDPSWHRAQRSFLTGLTLQNCERGPEALAHAEAAEAGFVSYGYHDDAAYAAMLAAQVLVDMGDRRPAIEAARRATELAESDEAHADADGIVRWMGGSTL